MPQYNYRIALSALSEQDKDRIVCLYLSSDDSSINWSKATKDYGSASIESFKKTTQNMLKKLDKAGAKDLDGEPAEGAGGEAESPPIKKKSNNPGRKKRKATDEESAAAEGEAAAEKPAPKKKKRGGGGRAAKKGGGPKKADTPVEDDTEDSAAEVEGTNHVKAEDAGEE